MKPTLRVLNDLERETHELRQANATAKALLSDAAAKLRAILQDEAIMTECRVEIWDAMDDTLEAVEAALRQLGAVSPRQPQSAPPVPGGPTRQQGQFLAFIRRVPHQARAIELTIAPDRIPPLDRPFKF